MVGALNFPKHVHNSDSFFEERNHDCDDVWISELGIFFSVFSLILVLIEKMYQKTLDMFSHISKHLKVRHNYSAVRRILDSLRASRCFEMSSNIVFRV